MRELEQGQNRMSKRQLICAIGFSAMAALSTTGMAEILVLPDGGYGVTEASVSPDRGDTDGDVLTRFGEPLERKGPVGSPAISSWVYPEFQVYFEDGVVIHAVQIKM